MGKRITSLQTASSVSSTDYLPIDGNNGTKKISAGFVNDIITDVTVDGTSVVSSGTAAISLSGKQDTLIPGSNITIGQDGKTISATDTTYSDMVGAGASTAGTHGLVPAPTSGDNTKFLRGDGTWQDVGGGGSSTLAGLTDVSLSSPTDGQGLIYDATNQEWVNGNVGGGGSSTLSGLTDTDITTPSNGQILKYDATSSKWINATASGGGVVMTGATSSVNGTQGEAPQPLAGDQEKVLTGAGTWTSLDNIGTSQIYLGDLIPRVTSDDNHITASSEGTYGSTIWSAWGALTTDISIQNVPASNSAWVNANGDSAPWIMYYFDESRYFTEVEIKAFSNYGSDFSGTIYIEASNDASAWTDIGGGAKTINAALSTLTTNTYSISNNNYWRYIRIRGIQSFFELSEPACFFQSLQVKGGKVGGGIVQYIDFSSLSSQQVEDLQNKIGGDSRTYLGQLIPRVSAADYKITASTSNSNYPAWGAFNGTSPSNLSSPEANSCWLPEANLTNQYIQYHFDAPRYFTKINIYCFSNYSTNWVGDIKIEGSSDGSTWENILASGDSTYELTADYQSITNVEINLDDTELWEYIRVTFVDEMSVAYQPSCFIDEIYVYGGEEIGGGGGNARFESTELLSSAISTGGTYTLEDAIENYDFVTIVSGASNESDIRTVAVEDILNTLSDGITVNLIGAADRWVNITAWSGTSITIAKNAPYIHSIKGYKLVGGGSSSSHNYSTTEQKVGTWIDGSDVWEKTINIEETTIHGNTSFTIDIETNIDILIEYSLMYRDIALQNGRWNPLDNVTEQIGYDMYRNRLYLESNGTLKGEFGGSSGVVTICGVIRYTKVSAS